MQEGHATQRSGVVWATALYAVVTVALLWPLMLRVGSAYAHDTGDPVLNTWILWWSTQAWPLSSAWWNGPILFPAADTLAYSELLLSLVPFSAVVQMLTGNPVTAFNVAFVLSFWLSGLSVYVLARQLTGRVDAALVGGLAFMLAPYRAIQLSHLQVLSYYWAPVALLGLHWYCQTSRRRWLVLFGTAWLLQILANGYSLFQLPVLIGLWAVWFGRSPRRVAAIALAGAVATLPMLPMLLKYYHVHSVMHFARDVNDVRRFGVDVMDFFSVAPDLWLTGGRLGAVRHESAAFPGFTILGLGVLAVGLSIWRYARDGRRGLSVWVMAWGTTAAAAGLAAVSVLLVGPWSLGPLSVGGFRKPLSVGLALAVIAFGGSRWFRRNWTTRSAVGFYAVAMGVLYLFALGPEPRFAGEPILYRPPYAWFMNLPGFSTMRVPARFLMLVALCQSLLVAFSIKAWANGRRRALVLVLVAGGILADGWIRVPVVPAPRQGFREWPGVSALVELPLGDLDTHFGALFRSMRHRIPIVNGISGYDPAHQVLLGMALRDGNYEALFDVAPQTPLGIVVDRSRGDSADTMASLERLGFRSDIQDERWIGYLRPRRAVPPDPVLGSELRIAAAQTSLQPTRAVRLHDQRVDTAWSSDRPQQGSEYVTVTLDSVSTVGGIELVMGGYWFGYPRALSVDCSADGATWVHAWDGPTIRLALRAVLADPTEAPMRISFSPCAARFVRLQQTGADSLTPWWVADIRVFGASASGTSPGVPSS